MSAPRIFFRSFMLIILFIMLAIGLLSCQTTVVTELGSVVSIAIHFVLFH